MYLTIDTSILLVNMTRTCHPVNCIKRKFDDAADDDDDDTDVTMTMTRTMTMMMKNQVNKKLNNEKISRFSTVVLRRDRKTDYRGVTKHTIA